MFFFQPCKIFNEHVGSHNRVGNHTARKKITDSYFFVMLMFFGFCFFCVLVIVSINTCTTFPGSDNTMLSHHTWANILSKSDKCQDDINKKCERVFRIIQTFVESICRKILSWKVLVAYVWIDKTTKTERKYYLLMGRKQQSVLCINKTLRKRSAFCKCVLLS